MLSALWLALAAPVATCAPPPVPSRAASRIDARAEIARDIADLIRLFECRDLDGFMQTYSASPDTTYLSGGKLSRGRAEIRAEYGQFFFAGPPQKLTLTPVQVKLLGGDKALVIARARLTAPSGETSFKAVSSLLLVREDGRWRILHDHTD